MRRDAVRRSGPGLAQRWVGGQIHGQQGLKVFEGAGLGEIGEDPAQAMLRSRPQALAASMRPYRLAEAWAPATLS